jgi:alkyl sulfatase BDS1-like metallo-beta-lactamase superfamily hydrolase
VAEIVNHLVFADPSNEAARLLQAETLEQMGYQAESGPWRAFYLTGAQELRYPRPPSAVPRPGAGNQIRALPADALLDALSVRLNGERATSDLAFNLAFSDTGETFAVSVENAVLHHRADRSFPAAPTITLARPTLVGLVLGEIALDAADVAVAGGEMTPFADLLARLDRFDFWFEIVMP